jgi:hypothetical protein
LEKAGKDVKDKTKEFGREIDSDVRSAGEKGMNFKIFELKIKFFFIFSG